MASEKVVRRTLADGSTKEYRYQRGGKKILPGSFGSLVQEYRKSPEFQKHRPNTHKTYLRAMGFMEDLYNSAIVDIKRRHIIKLRDRHSHTPAIANQIVAVFSILMNYAVSMEYRESNPARKVPFLKGGQYKRWSDEHIAFALKVLPERFRRALVLALYTGQRQGDVIAMKWSDYDGEGIKVTQEKTGAKLWIPCPAALRTELEAWKKDRQAVNMLTDSKGRPWRADSFATTFSAQVRQHVELKGMVFHGLRKTAAAKLAEAGCTAHEIGAITGHRTLAMLQLYTLEAEQKTRATAAILKLENVFQNRGDNRGKALPNK